MREETLRTCLDRLVCLTDRQTCLLVDLADKFAVLGSARARLLAGRESINRQLGAGLTHGSPQLKAQEVVSLIGHMAVQHQQETAIAWRARRPARGATPSSLASFPFHAPEFSPRLHSPCLPQGGLTAADVKDQRPMRLIVNRFPIGRPCRHLQLALERVAVLSHTNTPDLEASTNVKDSGFCDGGAITVHAMDVI